MLVEFFWGEGEWLTHLAADWGYADSVRASISHLRLEAAAYLPQLEVSAFFGWAHDAVDGVFGDEVAFDGAAFDSELTEAE